jgi:hypothetical protein
MNKKQVMSSFMSLSLVLDPSQLEALIERVTLPAIRIGYDMRKQVRILSNNRHRLIAASTIDQNIFHPVLRFSLNRL